MNPQQLVSRLGGHPASQVGIDLSGGDEALGAWLVLCCLLGGRVAEATACAGYRALAGRELASLAALGSGDPARLVAILSAAGHPRAEATAALLARVARALIQRHAGSLEAVARPAGDFAELASRIAALAPGVGAATVLRFLRPLREVWPAARETPLGAGAQAAARHLQLIGAGQDAEGEPTALRAALLRDAGSPALADVEAALTRLGAAACLRDRPERCPLGSDCPRRRGAGP